MKKNVCERVPRNITEVWTQLTKTASISNL